MFNRALNIRTRKKERDRALNIRTRKREREAVFRLVRSLNQITLKCAKFSNASACFKN